jgi:hypothetical protein
MSGRRIRRLANGRISNRKNWKELRWSLPMKVLTHVEAERKYLVLSDPEFFENRNGTGI